MKKQNLSVIEKENKPAKLIEREKITAQLLYLNERYDRYDLNVVAELEKSLSEKEMVCGKDSIVMLKWRGLFNQGKYLAAHKELTDALIKDPMNLYLIFEYDVLIEFFNKKLFELYKENSSDPNIRVLANLLKEEGELYVGQHVAYLRHMGEVGAASEIVEELETFVKLYPAFPGLREFVYNVNQELNSPVLAEYLARPAASVPFKTFTIDRTPEEFLKIKKIFRAVKEQMDSDNIGWMIEQVESVIGKSYLENRFDIKVLDLYEIRAALEMKQNKPMSAIKILLPLTQINPANMYLKSHLEYCFGHLQNEVTAKLSCGDYNGDIFEIYNFLRENHCVSLDFFRHFVRHLVRVGRGVEAKNLAQLLLNRDNRSYDNLALAFEVAVLTKDVEWLKELKRHTSELIKKKPYFVKHRMLVEPRLKPVIN